MTTSKHETAREKIEEIEREMRSIGYWQEEPLPAEAYDFTQAFAMDTMAYSQWLQFIFIPRVRSIIETDGDFPAGSSVGTQAIREFDGSTEAEGLVSLLCEFDRIIEG
jgi:uncharacterized protein YqcC (DUF446 family)